MLTAKDRGPWFNPGWLLVFHGSLKIFPSLSSCTLKAGREVGGGGYGLSVFIGMECVVDMVGYMVGRVPYVDKQQLEGRSFILPHTDKQLCHTDHSCVICTSCAAHET